MAPDHLSSADLSTIWDEYHLELLQFCQLGNLFSPGCRTTAKNIARTTDRGHTLDKPDDYRPSRTVIHLSIGRLAQMQELFQTEQNPSTAWILVQLLHRLFCKNHNRINSTICRSIVRCCTHCSLQISPTGIINRQEIRFFQNLRDRVDYDRKHRWS